ncbi:hypothetical protein GOODEAATRI_012882, partial [Goodea atripinnis]
INSLLLYRQHPMYNGSELRWPQPNPSPGGPYLAYPILSSPQPPVSNDYAYYQIMPAPCPPVMGFYQPFPGTYAGPVQAGVVSPVSADVNERPLPLGPTYGMASQRGRGMSRSNVLTKVHSFNKGFSGIVTTWRPFPSSTVQGSNRLYFCLSLAVAFGCLPASQRSSAPN